jgi:hypothetical protein
MLTPRPLIESARDAHAAFHRGNIPPAVALRALGTIQRALIRAAHELDRTWLAQPLTVILAQDAMHAPGTVGAGTEGGLPAVLDDAGNVVQVSQQSGNLAALDFGGEPDFGPFVATTIAADSLDLSAAGWTVNEWVGAYCVVLEGPSQHSLRRVNSNDADTLTFLPTEPWSEGAPTTASVLGLFLVAAALDQAQGVQTAVPALTERRGYLVKLDAQGNPYLDVTTPLVTSLETGIPLPPHLYLVDTFGVRYPKQNGQERYEPAAGALVAPGQRFGDRFLYGAYVQNQQLFLIGTWENWYGVASLELRYVPVAPDPATLDSVLLLPDQAAEACEALLTAFYATRVGVKGGLERDQVSQHRQDGDAARDAFLRTVGRSGRARPYLIKDVRL